MELAAAGMSEQARYENYCAWCWLMKLPIATLEEWRKTLRQLSEYPAC